jgi:hypothetical protein
LSHFSPTLPYDQCPVPQREPLTQIIRDRRIEAWGECMKKWFIALVCASTFLLAQNALAAFTFKRFADCGDGLVTVKTCECHASNSRVWHYCHAGYYCHTFDGSCRK